MDDTAVVSFRRLPSPPPEEEEEQEVKQDAFVAECEEYERSECEGRFALQGQYVFVTYNRSQVTDHEQFYEYLKASMEPRMPVLRAGELAKVQFYGARELHQDGTPHYHVLMAFEKGVHWRDARANLAVTIRVDGKEVVDTTSIRVKTKKRGESLSRFLNFVQAYIQKEGNSSVFGEWIEPDYFVKKHRKEAILRQVIAMESVEDCMRMLAEHFPDKYVWRFPAQFLATKKKRKRVEEYVPSFRRSKWRVPAVLDRWKKETFAPERSGRPRALLLVGPARTGKTEWAMSCAKTPVSMTNSWCFDALVDMEGCTHVVLNDIVVDRFPYWREFLGCQRSFVVTGKWRLEQTIEFEKPVIWTCNADNDPRKDRDVANYMKEANVLVVEIKQKLFIEEFNSN